MSEVVVDLHCARTMDTPVTNPNQESEIEHPDEPTEGRPGLPALVADLTKRFGCLKNGANDIIKHKFFQGLDYDQLLKRELTAPVIPLVKDDTDTSNFDPYPDSVEEAPMPVFSGKDPFAEF